MIHPLERRRIATQATVDRFKDEPFTWGRFDCGKMIAFHLRKMGRPIAHAKAGSYSDALGAARAMKRLGFDNLGALMTSRLEIIPPASALLGDLIEFEGDHMLGTLGVALGNNAALMYHEDAAGAVPCRIVSALTAWRVL